MPKITAIEPQKKKSDRFNLFLDGTFAAGISLEVLLKNNLKVGQTLDQTNLQKIVSSELKSKLFDRVLHFLSFRPRSEKEVRDYLTKKISDIENIKFSTAKDSPLIELIIKKLKKYKYLDDKEFSKWIVKSIVSSKKGPKAAKVEFFKKGIPKEISEEAIRNFPDQYQVAKKSIAKKLERWKKLPKLEFKKKVYQYLASKGFDLDVIMEVFASVVQKR